MSKLNLLLVGVGGQGTILASKVLAEVALMSGLDVKMSEIHGMAQRGGSVVTQVKIGPKVYSPLVDKGEADVILSFEQLEALRWLEYLRPGGEVVFSSQIIEPIPVILGKAQYPAGIEELLKSKAPKVTAVNALEIANGLGNPKVSNVVMMGVLARKLSFTKEVWTAALTEKIPERLRSVNLKAFDAGYGL